MYYFIPVCDQKWWNLFDHKEGFVEAFRGTKAMMQGDIVLFYAKYNGIAGIYGVGEIISDPYINLEDPRAHCYNKTTVDVRITRIVWEPLFDAEWAKEYLMPLQGTHSIKPQYNKMIKDVIGF